MLRSLFAAVFIAAVSPALAQTAGIEPLYEALRLGELLEIMREEGLGYGTDLEEDLFPGRGRSAWAATVASIYRLERMQSAIREGLEEELSDAQIGSILEFFATPEGERIVGLEVAARRAMLDEAVEQAAEENWKLLQANGGSRWALLSEFAEVNDLVESNVAGAMTANYAFYMGLLDGRAFEPALTEEEVLADVWSQEAAIREETVDWVFAFTSLAYQPLSDGEFQAYVDFAETSAGQILNAALFNVFNDMFSEISRDLGIGAARFLAGQDI